tara:strand:- start:1381 stop:1758 length:378 start_codon:yes stop_codon:yes gene_type:complete
MSGEDNVVYLKHITNIVNSCSLILSSVYHDDSLEDASSFEKKVFYYLQTHDVTTYQQFVIDTKENDVGNLCIDVGLAHEFLKLLNGGVGAYVRSILGEESFIQHIKDEIYCRLQLKYEHNCAIAH